MQIHQIRKGVYSLCHYNESIEGITVLAMHPLLKGGISYRRRLSNFIRNHNGTILTFEESAKLESTAERYRKLTNGFAKNRLFIRTQPQEPEPVDMTWRDMIKFLESIKNGSPFMLIGGYRYNDQSQDFMGCLGVLEAMIYQSKFNYEVNESLVFSNDHASKEKRGLI